MDSGAEQTSRNREAGDLSRRAAEVESENARLASRIAALESSTSWRLTAPLRFVSACAWRARQAARRSGRATPVATLAEKQDLRADLPPDRLPRRVLIVAEVSIPQCLRYRVRQKVQVLESMGWPATVVSWCDTSACRAGLATHGCVIFYRTPATPEVVAVAKEARAAGMTVFFEIDDLVFDLEEYATNSNLLALPPLERDQLLRGARFYRDMLDHVDHAIASTEGIAERFRRAGQTSVFTVHNALDRDLLAAAEAPPMRAVDAPVTIIYGSGTDTHDADFALAAPALARVMKNHPEVRLLLAGPLRVPAELNAVADRTVRLPLASYPDYLAALAGCDINLAPLEPSVFNDAKSNIKFLEASALRIPSVCSPSAEFRRVIEDGATGLLARNQTDWEDAITRLVQDAELRQRIGAAAREHVLRTHHPDALVRRELEPLLAAAFPPPPAADTARSADLKILVVNVHFAPQSFGGATVVAEQVAAELARLPGTQVSIFAGTHNADLPLGSLRRHAWCGLPVYSVRLPVPDESPHDHRSPRIARLFGAVLEAEQPDVIHFHCVQMLSADLVKVAQERGLPHVVTLHDAWWICERQFMVTGAGQYCGQSGVDPLRCIGCTPDAVFTQHRFHELGRILAGVDHLLTPSTFFRDLHLRTGIPDGQISVNRNGVRPAGPRSGRPSGPVTVAFLGGRGVHKGYFWLREILAGLDETDYRLKICDLDMIHGDGSIHPAEWKIGGRLDLTAPYTQDTIDEYYADIDVLLFPSLWKESFGLTVREALLRDIWVISTDCGGPVEDLVDGVNGTIVPMGDTMAFRQAVRHAIRDPGRLRSHVNPHKDRIRSFAEQARETRAFLAEAAAPKT